MAAPRAPLPNWRWCPKANVDLTSVGRSSYIIQTTEYAVQAFSVFDDLKDADRLDINL